MVFQFQHTSELPAEAANTQIAWSHSQSSDSVPMRMLSRFSRVQLFVTLWTVACQAPLSMGFSSQEYWRGLPCPPPGDLPKRGIKPMSLMSPALAGRFFTTSNTVALRICIATKLPRDAAGPETTLGEPLHCFSTLSWLSISVHLFSLACFRSLICLR